MGSQWMPSQVWDVIGIAPNWSASTHAKHGKHGITIAILVEGLPCSIHETTTSNVKPGFRFTLVVSNMNFISIIYGIILPID